MSSESHVCGNASSSGTSTPKVAGSLQGLLRHVRKRTSSALEMLGYDRRNWLRVVQIESWNSFLAAHAPIRDILEISPGWQSPWAQIDGCTYRSVSYPTIDITQETLDEQFQIIVADQVLEHVADPIAAVTNIRKMVRPGGYALIATPFLFRVHRRPGDCWRWTEDGLRLLLKSGGFSLKKVQTHSWGNQRCARAHLSGRVKPFGFGKDLSNDPEYPLMVWAFAGV